ncbi:hypothetical protein AB852_19360 [Streptomyces uncialis]|uniref:Uncharacterized protein n=1 Tax=Streptomyces uncialis TaxID=1048205 RepID=A0A1Q4V709_9ACTN|nr:hypothetical protein AB852_19360 [Streptomyces uncialis]
MTPSLALLRSVRLDALVPAPFLAPLGFHTWAYLFPCGYFGGAQFPAPLWGAFCLFFGSGPVGILRPRSDTLGTTYVWSY